MSKILSTAKSAWMQMFLALAVLLLSAGQVYGQAQTAEISGTATDASGAALVGANVQATNVETNASRSTATDSTGHYKIAQLPVGTYNLQASLAGFQTVIHTGAVLAIGSSVIVDFSLPVGQVTETVSVEAQVSRVETETSEISTLISPRQMRELPLNGRNFTQLLTLAPGVSTIAPALNAVTGRMYGMMDNYSVAGSRPTGQMFLLDGVDIRNFWEHGTGSGYGGTSLGVEAIGEFQVLTNTYTAQFAGNGAVVNGTSRSGTNDFHGAAYEFIRNNVLDARDIVDPVSGPPPFRRNQFGGAIGGPIKKDKLFFFGNYEGLRQNLATTTNLALPEPYLVQGKINCGSVGGAAAAPITVADSCVPSDSTNSTQPGIMIGTPQNSFSGLADANPRSQQIAALYSLCQGCELVAPLNPLGSLLSGNEGCVVAGCDLGGYYQVATTPNLIINEDYIMGRVDYTLGTNDSLFGRYVIDNAKIGDPRDPMGIFPETDHTRNQLLVITQRHVASATLVNSLRFGYVRNNENSAAQPTLTDAQITAANAFSTGLGGPAITTDPLRFVPAAGFPGELPRQSGQNAGFNGIPTIGPDPNRPGEIVQNKFSVGDDLVWIHGAHSLKFGAVVTRVQTQNLQTAYSNGGFFLVYATVGVGTPQFLYDAGFPKWLFDRQSYVGQVWLEGLPLVAFAVPQGANNATRYFREIMIAPYIQDDWKVTSRLTLNLGFRYDYGTNPVGWAFGNQPMTTIVNSFLPPFGPQLNPAGNPFTPVKHVFSHNINAGNFSPRFGFAYDPFQDHKTSIRGGVGLFFDPTAGRLWESNFINTAPSGFSVPAPVFSIDPTHPNDVPVQFPDICGPGLPAPDTCNVPGATGEFAGVTYQPKGGSPYQLTYNLSVQREIARGTVLSIGYVGSVARHLWTQGDINPPRCIGSTPGNTFPDCTGLPQIPTSRPSASDATYTFVPGNANACMESGEGGQNDDTAGPGGTPAPGLGRGCYGSGAQFATFATASGGTAGPRINSAFASVVQAHNTGSSAYSSLQVALNRQFARNLAGQVNYTWSRCVDNGSFASSLEQFAQLVTNRYNQRYDFANCTFDIRHNISANALYALPFKGNRLVEGWQIATITGIHTGLPLNIYNGLNFNDPADMGTQWASRANYTFAPGCSPNRLLKQRISPTATQWFDDDCYEAQAPGFLGNVKRNSVPGPGTLSLDFSITKNTKITESLNAQFRVECFNCINHFNVGGTGAGILGAINAPGDSDGQTTFSQSPVITPRQIQFALKLDF